MNYFNIADYIELKPETTRYYIVGMRGAGKSYSIKKYLWQRFRDHNEKFVYIRRVSPDITRDRMDRVFSDFTETDPEFNPQVLGYGDFYRYHILCKSGSFWLVGETENGELEYLVIMGTVTCISMAERFKGGTYLGYKYLFFDEFITEGRYITDNEPEMFNKILLTVARGNNQNVKCFFAGNPDAIIERCPYLFPLKLDYAHLQNNTPYYYDTKIMDKTYANNVLFIKIAGADEGYINLSAIDTVNSEIEMSITGEVKTKPYFKITHEIMQQFNPQFEIIIETPIITDTDYHKKIYVYLANLYNQPALYILSHRYKQKRVESLYCRYDLNDIRNRHMYQTYRLNFPAKFYEVRAVFNDALNTAHIITDNNINVSLVLDLLKNN